MQVPEDATGLEVSLSWGKRPASLHVLVASGGAPPSGDSTKLEADAANPPALAGSTDSHGDPAPPAVLPSLPMRLTWHSLFLLH